MPHQHPEFLHGTETLKQAETGRLVILSAAAKWATTCVTDTMSQARQPRVRGDCLKKKKKKERVNGSRQRCLGTAGGPGAAQHRPPPSEGR